MAGIALPHAFGEGKMGGNSSNEASATKIINFPLISVTLSTDLTPSGRTFVATGPEFEDSVIKRVGCWTYASNVGSEGYSMDFIHLFVHADDGVVGVVDSGSGYDIKKYVPATATTVLTDTDNSTGVIATAGTSAYTYDVFTIDSSEFTTEGKLAKYGLIELELGLVTTSATVNDIVMVPFVEVLRKRS